MIICNNIINNTTESKIIIIINNIENIAYVKEVLGKGRKT